MGEVLAEGPGLVVDAVVTAAGSGRDSRRGASAPPLPRQTCPRRPVASLGPVGRGQRDKAGGRRAALPPRASRRLSPLPHDARGPRPGPPRSTSQPPPSALPPHALHARIPSPLSSSFFPLSAMSHAPCPSPPCTRAERVGPAGPALTLRRAECDNSQTATKEVFRKPDQVLNFGHLWSRSSDFSGGFIFSGHCDSANRFQVLPYSFMVKEYSSPYNDLVALTDGTFLKLCRPGRLGNQILQIDQPEGQLYHETSEKAVSST